MSTVVTKEANFASDLSAQLDDRLATSMMMMMMISWLADDIKHACLYRDRLDVRMIIIIDIVGRSFVTHPHECWSWSIASRMRFHITLVQTSRALIIYHQSFCVCRNNNILTSRKQAGSGENDLSTNDGDDDDDAKHDLSRQARKQATEKEQKRCKWDNDKWRSPTDGCISIAKRSRSRSHYTNGITWSNNKPHMRVGRFPTDDRSSLLPAIWHFISLVFPSRYVLWQASRYIDVDDDVRYLSC